MLSTTPATSSAPSTIVTTTSIKDIVAHLEHVDAQSMVLLDIDNTVITPKSRAFRVGSPYENLIDDIKKNRKNLPNFSSIISNWRQQRHAMLLAPEWPALINRAKARNCPVYALTQMDTGKEGGMQDIEVWRYQELSSFGVFFTPTFHEQSYEELLPATQGVTAINSSSSALFYRGFFMTGTFSKGRVLEIILSKPHTIKHLIFIDDRQDHVHEIGAVCAVHKIAYTGIIFRAIETLADTPWPEVAALQKEHLLQHAQWLEDEEAEALLLAQQALTPTTTQQTP